ncbi:uncharacterized protein LOC144157912 [Haemaphysalis longicornis]
MRVYFCGFVTVFIVCCLADSEVAEIMAVLDSVIRENGGTEELKQKTMGRIRIARQCSREQRTLGPQMFRKVTLPTVTEGTKCASKKSMITDPVERDIAEKECFREASLRQRNSGLFTAEEIDGFDTMAACIASHLPVVKP